MPPCSIIYKDKIHYVGTALINNRMKHFVVADWLLNPNNAKQGLFKKMFLKSLKDNEPMGLGPMHKDKLKRATKEAQDAHITQIKPIISTSNEALMFVGKLGNGEFDCE
eukprot:12632874-Ditylum_brightwellii.AAC.1